MAPQEVKPSGAANGEVAEEALPIGPPSGLAPILTQYLTEHTIRQMLKSVGNDIAREDSYRLKGVQLIDSVRESLQLWVFSTNDTHSKTTLTSPLAVQSKHLTPPRYTITSSASTSPAPSTTTKTLR